MGEGSKNLSPPKDRDSMYIFFRAALLAIALIICSHEHLASKPSRAADWEYAPSRVRPILEQQQRAAFDYFRSGAEPNSGMAYESSRGNNRKITIGGSGFGMMSLLVGAERGWITREEAAEQVSRMIQFLMRADRYRGAWSHWYKLDGRYAAFGDQKAAGDIVESAFMVAGLLAASEYFDRDIAVESKIRSDVEQLWNTIEWSGYTNDEQTLYWIWYSLTDQYKLKINGYNEALLPYLFALAAPEGHNIPVSVYRDGWLNGAPNSYKPNRTVAGYKLPFGRHQYGGPLFFAHYSFLGLDPRNMADSRCDYWTQNTSHAMLNREYCYYAAPKERRYGNGIWGITACRGAGSANRYSARSPHNDDGVIAPTAALASYPYTPLYSTQALLAMNAMEGLRGDFGLGDSFNPAEGAYTTSNLAIDQGPIVVMIENYRSSMIWDLLSRNRHVARALALAELDKTNHPEGFVWATIESRSQRHDMMMHPDREQYEVNFASNKGGEATLTVVESKGGSSVASRRVTLETGVNTIGFADDAIRYGESYTIRIDAPSGVGYSLDVVLN